MHVIHLVSSMTSSRRNSRLNQLPQRMLYNPQCHIKVVLFWYFRLKNVSSDLKRALKTLKAS